MAQKLPVVAIVGQANVGKSSLFNAILRRQEAIVAREAGTTRDSVYRMIELDPQHSIWLVDTAGLKSAEDEFEATIQEQIEQATEAADLIILVVDAGSVVSSEDRSLAKRALKSKKPVILVVNKIDQASNLELDTWKKLGIKDIVGTSTTQRQGIKDLQSEILEHVPARSAQPDDPDTIKIALLGRPNAGKSHLFNTLAKKQQAIVRDIAGTTRDINRTSVRFKGKTIELLDTAGIRRKGKIEQGIEKFSILRTLQAIEQSDICLLIMDSTEHSTALDQKIAGMANDAGKSIIIVVSKWDQLEPSAETTNIVTSRVANNFQFIAWAPLIFTSAITGKNVAKIMDLAIDIQAKRIKQIPTTKLNQLLFKVMSKHPPAGLKNRHPKPRYMVQDDIKPPTFRLYGSHLRFLHWSWKNYLEKQIRQEFELGPTPIKIYLFGGDQSKSAKDNKSDLQKPNQGS